MENEGKNKFVDKYLSWDITRKELFWISIIDGIVFVILMPFFAIGWLKLSLGWLIGSIASIGSFILINLPSKKEWDEKKAKIIHIVLTYVVPIALLVILLIVSGICTFKSDWFSGFDLFSVYTIVFSYLVAVATFIIGKTYTPKAIKEVDSQEESSN